MFGYKLVKKSVLEECYNCVENNLCRAEVECDEEYLRGTHGYYSNASEAFKKHIDSEFIPEMKRIWEPAIEHYKKLLSELERILYK